MHTLVRCFKVLSGARLLMYYPAYPVFVCHVYRKIRFNKFSIYSRTCSKTTGSEGTSIVPKALFDHENKDKNTFLATLEMFKEREIRRTGHVEFIYAAIRYMGEFGVEKDLEVYKAVINVLPKGKFIPTNIFQAEFMHYPKQQQCAIDVLEKMENNGVIPDKELETILLNIFGRRGYPLRKYWRMMYWMPKFKYLSPWPLPNPVPSDSFELAMLGIKRISSVDPQTQISVYQAADLEDSLDKTWIISAQSPTQKDLLARHPENVSVYVEGPFLLWLRNAQVYYFIIRTDNQYEHKEEVDEDDVSFIKNVFADQLMSIHDKEDEGSEPTVHEQEDGAILAVCATGTSSRDSLLSWIRHLESDDNPILKQLPVLFTLKSPLSNVVPIENNEEEKEEKPHQEIPEKSD